MPGSLESRLLRRGSALLRDYAARAGIPVERTGALLVAWTAEQEAALPEIAEKARQNGYTAVRPVTPRRASTAGAASRARGRWPRWRYRTRASSARGPRRWPTPPRRCGPASGWSWAPGSPACAAAGGAGTPWRPPAAPLRCRWLVNAAGLDERPDRRDARRRRVHDPAAPRRAHRLRQAGPAAAPARSCCRCRPRRPRACWWPRPCTATCCSGRPRRTSTTVGDTATTAAGLAALLRRGPRDRPGPARRGGHRDLRRAAGRDRAPRLPDPGRPAAGATRASAGIRSTGLSASLGIAEYVAGPAGRGGAAAAPSAARPPAGPPAMPYIGEAGTRPYQDAGRIAADPEYGRIVCHCERVTRGEIRDALASTAAARGHRRAAAPDQGAERPVPGLLLRRHGVRPDGGAGAADSGGPAGSGAGRTATGRAPPRLGRLA